MCPIYSALKKPNLTIALKMQNNPPSIIFNYEIVTIGDNPSEKNSDLLLKSKISTTNNNNNIRTIKKSFKFWFGVEGTQFLVALFGTLSI